VGRARDNVEVVKAIYAAFAGRDEDELAMHTDPSMTVHNRPEHPEASAQYQGREGFVRFTRTDWAAFDEVRYEPLEFVVRGEYVIVPITQRGKGKGSAVGIEENIVNVWKLRDGKCIELRIYSTMDEALEALGPEPYL
jgi:ketosteroid isomerase-like protein